jgi:hypothetical protein
MDEFSIVRTALSASEDSTAYQLESELEWIDY